jgi:SPOR domain
MTAPATRRPFDWEAAGRELGDRLADFHAVVVAGFDPVATGHVAVGLARAQSGQRRVAVGDLFAESPPIQELVTTDDPHGIVDSFLYGVSLTKIACPVPDAGQLFVMRSGTEAPQYDEILSNPRWHRLTAGFREVGALLILAVPMSAPQLDKLVAATDGVIYAGLSSLAHIPPARVIASVREPRRPSGPTLTLPVPPSTLSKISTLSKVSTLSKISTLWRSTLSRIWTPSRISALSRVLTLPRMSKRQVAAFGGIGLTIVAAFVAAWLAYRPLAGSTPISRREPDCKALAASGQPCVPRAGQRTVAMTLDSVGSASHRDSVKSAGTVVSPAPLVANPGDSAAATPFAVQLIAANMQAGAILKLQQDGKNLPAATFSPVIIQGVRWFRVVSGAFATSAGADSLLDRLRQRKLLSAGNVVRLPFAFRIDSGVPASAVPAMVANYVDHGQPAYALRQADGTAWLLIGAYESPEQASLYREALPSGTRPVLVYRKGRLF